MVPWLAESVPTVDNGGVSADLTTITWKLKEGLVWSDGTAVTSADIIFSHGNIARTRKAAVRRARNTTTSRMSKQSTT